MSTKLFACAIPDSGRQAEHIAAYELLHRVLAAEYGITVPEIARDNHGKPFLSSNPAVHFNLSHCTGLAVCAVGASPLGIDAEMIRPLRQNVLRRSFSPEEAAAVIASPNPAEQFFRGWTLKESFVKAIGVGISYPLREVVFSMQESCIQSNQSDWQFAQFKLQEKWIISCCISVAETLPQNIVYYE